MPTTTRSANKQPKLEEIKGTVTEDKKANESRKRRALPPQETSSKKHQAGSEEAKTPDDTGADVITINRAPVLELWASCVAHFLYPEVPWVTCLSVGCGVAMITALAKGRSIGTMEKPEPGGAEERRQRRKEKAEKDQLDELEVMSFHLMMKDGQAMVGDKLKKGNEAALQKKYGAEPYERAKGAMQEVLSTWKGKEMELDRKAFKMYEDFRPTVPLGQKGWGRKGQLNLQNVKSAVSAG